MDIKLTLMCLLTGIGMCLIAELATKPITMVYLGMVLGWVTMYLMLKLDKKNKKKD